MKPMLTKTASATLLLAGSLAFGGQEDSMIVTPPAPTSSWEFRIEPYLWLTGLNGTIGVRSLSTDIDSSFGDVFDKLDMAAALQFEARNGRWGIIADGFYADLGADGTTPGPIYEDVNLEMQQFFGELAVAYRIYEGPNGFVDLYGGMRYNNLSMDIDTSLNVPGIQTVSENVSERIVDGIVQQAEEVIQPKIEEYKAASVARRDEIENEILSRIKTEAGERVKRQVALRLKRIRKDGDFNLRDVELSRITRAVKAQRIELARSTAELAVARIRAKADASLAGKVSAAQSRVQDAEQNLADAVSTQLQNRLPQSASAEKEWVDPIIGVRAQWNFNEKWFLAGKSDVGGFGVGSDMAWTVQGTVGYNFTESVSAELGYRYFDTDYSDGDFSYDLAEHGLFMGVNVKF